MGAGLDMELGDIAFKVDEKKSVSIIDQTVSHDAPKSIIYFRANKYSSHGSFFFSYVNRLMI
jgi:hypothetical protein